MAFKDVGTLVKVNAGGFPFRNTATFSFERYVEAGQEVRVTLTDPNNRVSSIQWGDGASSSGADATHEYSVTDYYTVIVIGLQSFGGVTQIAVHPPVGSSYRATHPTDLRGLSDLTTLGRTFRAYWRFDELQVDNPGKVTEFGRSTFNRPSSKPDDKNRIQSGSLYDLFDYFPNLKLYRTLEWGLFSVGAGAEKVDVRKFPAYDQIGVFAGDQNNFDEFRFFKDNGPEGHEPGGLFPRTAMRIQIGKLGRGEKGAWIPDQAEAKDGTSDPLPTPLMRNVIRLKRLGGSKSGEKVQAHDRSRDYHRSRIALARLAPVLGLNANDGSDGDTVDARDGTGQYAHSVASADASSGRITISGDLRSYQYTLGRSNETYNSDVFPPVQTKNVTDPDQSGTDVSQESLWLTSDDSPPPDSDALVRGTQDYPGERLFLIVDGAGTEIMMSTTQAGSVGAVSSGDTTVYLGGWDAQDPVWKRGTDRGGADSYSSLPDAISDGLTTESDLASGELRDGIVPAGVTVLS